MNELFKKSNAENVQTILTSMLQDEDIHHCVDCDSKDPRWASCNLEVFLSASCAVIHRTLGVHTSKVKSFDMEYDWTINISSSK